MAYNAVALLHVRKKFYHQRFGGKKFLNKTNHPYPQLPPPLPQNSNGIAAFDFVSMLRKRRGKKTRQRTKTCDMY